MQSEGRDGEVCSDWTNEDGTTGTDCPPQGGGNPDTFTMNYGEITWD